MTSEQQKALDKIKKCLRLAGSGNQHEADAALRQAQALINHAVNGSATLTGLEHHE